MKKTIFSLIIATAAVAIISCNTTTSMWTKEQRKTIHRALYEYRDMVYIDELTNAEFYIFSDNVTDYIEQSHPRYNEFISFPAVEDSIEYYVTTVIVEQLDADGDNMRKIYPYRDMKKDGRLPHKLNRKELRSFYKCLARKINTEYSDFGSFFNAVLADTTNKSQIATFEAECAKSLFNYTGEESNKNKIEHKK